MNERMLELYKQAGTKAYELCKAIDYKVGAIDTIWVSMMAATLSELVVKECCDLFVELRTRPADLAAKDVKALFGIEE